MAPVIIATDKTQLTQFSGSKSAYPVYLTIGNLPKSIRRKPTEHACVLIAYLSVDKIRHSHLTEIEHRSRVHRVFHESMKIVLDPLRKAGLTGIEMTSADGCVRKVYPILSAYVADYPEQCLVTCTKSTTCPKCQAPADHMEDLHPFELRTQNWTLSVLQDAKSQSSTSRAFYTACMKKDVAGGVYEPFWYNFPLTDIHRIMTPDVLHQLYQGIFKHILAWCQCLFHPEELDSRIRSLPISHGLRQFKNGFSALSQVSGPERKNMAKILLGCLVGKLPNSGISAIRSCLDFIYIAQYKTHDSTTLGYLDLALKEFHKHRSYFVEAGIRKDFNIPKFHSLVHYVESIKLFGTTDNYNTEMFERLHIDFAKEGWRASNLRDEFPQMIRWLSRQEKIVQFESKLLTSNPKSNSVTARTQLTPDSQIKNPPISIAKRPHAPGRLISQIELSHNAPGLSKALKEYLNTFLANTRTSARRAANYDLPFHRLDIYHMFRLHPTSLVDDEEEHDIIKATPKSKKFPDGRFDTAVVLYTDDAESTGLQGKFLNPLIITVLTLLFESN